MSGYDQFFKQAQKNTGLIKGDAKVSPKSNGSKKAPRFPLNKNGDKISIRAHSRGGKAGGTPEDRLREELALRMRSKRSQAITRKKKFPTYAVACVIALAITCGIGYYKSDLLDEVIETAMSKVEFGFLGEAEAATEGKPEAKPAAKTQEKAAAKEAKPAAKTAETKEAASGPEAQPPKGWTTEEMSFFSKLNDRKKELDAREADLAKLEEELQKRKTELDEKLKQLETTREEISKALKSRVTSDQQQVSKLVEFYSTMKPQQAAKVIETLNEDLAVEILDHMKKKNAAEVLNVMDAKKARRLSELLTGYQRTTASVGSGDGAEEKPAQ